MKYSEICDGPMTAHRRGTSDSSAAANTRRGADPPTIDAVTAYLIAKARASQPAAGFADGKEHANFPKNRLT